MPIWYCNYQVSLTVLIQEQNKFPLVRVHNSVTVPDTISKKHHRSCQCLRNSDWHAQRSLMCRNLSHTITSYVYVLVAEQGGTSGHAAANRSQDHLQPFRRAPRQPNVYRKTHKGWWLLTATAITWAAPSLQPSILPVKNTTMAEKREKNILKFECDSKNHTQEPFLHRHRHTFFILSQHCKILFTTINNKTYNRTRSVLLGFFFASAAHVLFSFKTTTDLFFPI